MDRRGVRDRPPKHPQELDKIFSYQLELCSKIKQFFDDNSWQGICISEKLQVLPSNLLKKKTCGLIIGLLTAT